jgi:hypothetical protein
VHGGGGRRRRGRLALGPDQRRVGELMADSGGGSGGGGAGTSAAGTFCSCLDFIKLIL